MLGDFEEKSGTDDISIQQWVGGGVDEWKEVTKDSNSAQEMKRCER